MNTIIVKCSACGAKNRVADTKQHLGPLCGACGEKVDVRSFAVPVLLGDATMDKFIRSVKLPVMVDFFSKSCGPCATLMPIIDSMARQYLGKVIIAKVDAGNNPGCTAHHRIKGVPTLIFFKDGEAVDEIVGVPERSHLQAKLDYYSN